MSITIYILCFNEEILLPYTLEHYKRMFPAAKVVVVDNVSTDATVHIAKGYGCEVISFDTEGKLSDLNFQHIKNNYWKHATSDFVLVCDCDEWLFITEEELGIEAQRGRTIIRSEAYHMINMEDNLDLAGITHGFRDEQTAIFYDKCLLFDRTQIQEINYNVGAHSVRPVGRVSYTDGTYKLYHYKYISPDYLVNRYKSYAERMSQENITHSYGGQFLETEQTIRTQFEENRAKSVKIL